MRQSLVLLAVLISSIWAENVSFFFPGGYEGVDPVATIEKVNPSTTQFHIACPSGTKPEDCGWGPGVEYTIISKTRYQAAVSYSSSSMDLVCDYNSQKTEMACSVGISGGTEYISAPKTATLTGSDVFFIQASVVSGASLLSDASATPTGTGFMTTAVATGSAAAGGHVSGSGAQPTGTSGGKTGAAARFGLEGSALLALAGAAALNAL